MFNQIRTRLRALVSRGRAEADFDEELRFHLEREVERNVSRGMSAESATAVARRALGNMGETKERARQTWTWRFLDEAATDVRYALRGLRRRRALAVVGVATIAIGIGSATATYSVVDGVLLRPWPFRDASRLVSVWQTNPQYKKSELLARDWDHVALSLPQYRDLLAQQTVFEDVAVWMPQSATLIDGEHPEVLSTIAVSPSMFAVLGVYPVRGRAFTSDEATPTGARVALVSYEAWQSRFGGAKDILGRIVRFEDAPREIVGILPPRLEIDRAVVSGTPEFWIPIGQDSMNYVNRGAMNSNALARVRVGIPLERAALEVNRIVHPSSAPDGSAGARVVPWQADTTREARGPLLLLLVAVGLLLLISSLNISTLLLGEGTMRDPEMAMRVALGATRARLVRQLLAESLVLVSTGAVVGVIMAWWGTRALVGAAPLGIPGLADVGIDVRVLAFAAVVAGLTGVGAGIVPALRLSVTSSTELMRAGAGQSARGQGRLQNAIVAVELCLSVLLLVGAGLTVRTLQNISNVHPGFRADNLLFVKPSLPRQMIPNLAAVGSFYSIAREKIAAIPGVVAVTESSQPPFVGGPSRSPFSLEDEVDPTATGRMRQLNMRWVQQRVVVPGYFSTLGIPILAGRDFQEGDQRGAENVAIVSDIVVRRDFGGHLPIGRRIYFLGSWLTIVGVVGDVHFSHLSADIEATLYAPSTQRGPYGLAFLVRTSGDPALATASVRRSILEAEPMVAIVGADVMTDAVNRSFAEQRYRALLFALFGVMATVLASVGIYGVTMRAVKRRLREAAIRAALGATRQTVRRALVSSTLRSATVGICVGLIASLIIARLLVPYLFGVSARDPFVLATVAALLAVVSFAASWLPTRRVGHIPVAELLRSD